MMALELACMLMLGMLMPEGGGFAIGGLFMVLVCAPFMEGDR